AKRKTITRASPSWPARVIWTRSSRPEVGSQKSEIRAMNATLEPRTDMICRHNNCGGPLCVSGREVVCETCGHPVKDHALTRGIFDEKPRTPVVPPVEG